MYIRKSLQFLCLAIVLGGCSLGGPPREAARPSDTVSQPDLDAIFARRFALEDFENRLGAAKSFYDTGSFYLFRTTRDSLLSDVNAYIRLFPHSEGEPEFVRLLDHLSILDTLTVVYPKDNDGYSATEDSLALTFADWPEIDIALDDGRLFSHHGSIFPEIDNNRIDFWIKYFTGPGRKRFERAVYRMQLYRPIVEAILDEKDLPEELACLALIESGYSMKAVSSAAAVGPWQFIPGTARIYRLRMNWWYDERRDIVASTYAASNYLSDLHGIWGDWFLAFAGYNCGEYRVARQIARQHTDDFWKMNLPRQTQRYIPKFLAALYILRDPAKYDIDIPDVEPIEFDEVTVTDATDLKIIAQSAGTSVETIKSMNPQCLRWSTPPQMEVIIKVPKGTGEICKQRLSEIPAEERVTYLRHKVRKGETLSVIASAYGTSIGALKQLNGISNKHFIREGKSLLVPAKGASTAVAVSSKPSYRDSKREIDKKALEKYASRGAPPKGYKRLVYTVKDKDTLGEIAEVYKTSASRIRGWNNLSYRRYIYPGQKLAIYVPDSFGSADRQVAEVVLPDPSSHRKSQHVVVKGETFYSISRRHKVTVAEILAWNNKSHGSIIHPGDVLTIWKEKE